MKPEQFSSDFDTQQGPSLQKQMRLFKGLGAVGIALAIGATPAQAQAETELEAPAPTPVETAPPVAPVQTSAEALLAPQAAPEPTPATSAIPKFEAAPAPVPSPVAPAPEIAPAPQVVQPEVLVESQPPTVRFSDAFIDTTDYSLGATTSRDTPSLVFSDRSSGCQFTLQQGQSAPARSCGAGTAGGGLAASGSGSDAGYGGGYSTAQYDDGANFSIGPVSIGGNGITVGNTTVVSREYFNEKLRTLNVLRRGAEEFVFPLAIPSPITSLFGWRVHPVFGDRRFHTGTDMGAPEGTPVVATKDGEVHVADYLGGYGLTVILRHEEGALETRYAHLSRLLVRPGETVKQGEVVGLVGNTGNSTGPHLHFELRELTAQGWVILNPDELMQITVANLVDAINNPLLALGLTKDDQTKDGGKDVEEALNLPYRPAQPNAN